MAGLLDRLAEEPPAPTWRTRIMRRWWWLQVPIAGVIVAQLYASPKIGGARHLADELEAEANARLEEAIAETASAGTRLQRVREEALAPSLRALRAVEQTKDSLAAAERRARLELQAIRAEVRRLEDEWVARGARVEDRLHERNEAKRRVEDREFAVSLITKSVAIASHDEQAIRDGIYRLEHSGEFEAESVPSTGEAK